MSEIPPQLLSGMDFHKLRSKIVDIEDAGDSFIDQATAIDRLIREANKMLYKVEGS